MNASSAQARDPDHDNGDARITDSDPHGSGCLSSAPGLALVQLQSGKPATGNPQFKALVEKLETSEASLFLGGDNQRFPRLAFTIKETASMLFLSDTTVRRLVAQGILKRLPNLRHVRIAGREILRYLK